MLIAGVIVFCVLLVILAFLFPRLSRHPERGGQKVMGTGSRGAGKAPGKLGQMLAKPFHKSSKAISKSGSAGRRGRSKVSWQGVNGGAAPYDDGAARPRQLATGWPVGSSPARSSRSFSR